MQPVVTYYNLFQPILTMFDTHAHLNFKRFAKTLDDVLRLSHLSGVKYIVVPGTDEESSQKAVEIASRDESVFAAVGIHPHHVFLAHTEFTSRLQFIENFLQEKKVLAVGEIGLDKHVYEDTKYQNYHIDEMFFNLQKEFLIKQLQLAKNYKKSVILHNREAKNDLLGLLNEHWEEYFRGRIVFHCCEPEEELLGFAKNHDIFIGVDGDITYDSPPGRKKQEFIMRVPQEHLVLETDSPFLLPEPLRSQKQYPNTPVNLPIIAEFVAKLRGESIEDLVKITTENALRLFNIH
ncbi:hypothetical protein A3H80_00660 [Candidatus Roizmanbacteria bacterium RIFCSPLOWO2_02_FULL_37_19]|nr:MAG: hypothetical protein A3H80_00660 [Candidatus Roizmanbacteria bacterium RIFCSPLOWO2_02_FULL_37_19]